MTIKLGTKLGRYEIRSKIGAGGMDEVNRTVSRETFSVEAINPRSWKR